MRRTIDVVLAEARTRLRRVSAAEAAAAMDDGWLLIDTRSGDIRARDGAIPGAVRAPLSVLEWRVDPTAEAPDPVLAASDGRFILICEHGYSSSLAAVRLHELGFPLTTDVVGGFEAWAAADLPVTRETTSSGTTSHERTSGEAPGAAARVGAAPGQKSCDGRAAWDR